MWVVSDGLLGNSSPQKGQKCSHGGRSWQSRCMWTLCSSLLDMGSPQYMQSQSGEFNSKKYWKQQHIIWNNHSIKQTISHTLGISSGAEITLCRSAISCRKDLKRSAPDLRTCSLHMYSKRYLNIFQFLRKSNNFRNLINFFKTKTNNNYKKKNKKQQL